MNTAKKTVPQNEEGATSAKNSQKSNLRVSKKEEATKPQARTVSERLENATKFEQLIKRREVLKNHKDGFEKFLLADSGFGSSIILKNEAGGEIPIKNPEALKQIYPFLTGRINEALERVDSEILAFEV